MHVLDVMNDLKWFHSSICSAIDTSAFERFFVCIIVLKRVKYNRLFEIQQ